MVDWYNVIPLIRDGGLYKYIKTISQKNWDNTDPLNGGSLLHYACCTAKNNDAIKTLILNGVDVNIKDIHGESPLIYCIRATNFIGFKMLYKSGADITARDNSAISIFEWSLINSYNSLIGILIVKFLIANGLRLKNVQNRFIHHITTEMRQFESGVLKCRRVTIAMLHSKRKLKLAKWDKYLLAQLANYIWATRDDPKWQE